MVLRSSLDKFLNNTQQQQITSVVRQVTHDEDWKTMDEDLLIISGQLRYPINFRRYLNQNSLHLRRWEWEFSYFRRWTRNRALDYTNKQISSIESQISRSALSILIEM